MVLPVTMGLVLSVYQLAVVLWQSMSALLSSDETDSSWMLVKPALAIRLADNQTRPWQAGGLLSSCPVSVWPYSRENAGT